MECPETRPPAGVRGGAAELVDGDSGGAGEDAEIGAPPGAAEGREARSLRRPRHCHLGSSLRYRARTRHTAAGSGGLVLIGEAGPTGRVDAPFAIARGRDWDRGGRWQRGFLAWERGGSEEQGKAREERGGSAPGDLYHSCRWDKLLQRPVSSGAATPTRSPQLHHFF